MPRDPEHRDNLLRKKINDLLENSQNVDDRLSEGELHAVTVAALGHEPLVFVADILALAINTKSKITLTPGEAIKGALALHDRLYGGDIQRKARKRTAEENQFTLDFGWSNVGEEANEGTDTERDQVA